MEDAKLEVLATAGLHILAMCSEFAENLKRTLKVYPELMDAFGVAFYVNTPIISKEQSAIQVLVGNSEYINKIKEELHDERK